MSAVAVTDAVGVGPVGVRVGLRMVVAVFVRVTVALRVGVLVLVARPVPVAVLVRDGVIDGVRWACGSASASRLWFRWGTACAMRWRVPAAVRDGVTLRVGVAVRVADGDSRLVDGRGRARAGVWVRVRVPVALDVTVGAGVPVRVGVPLRVGDADAVATRVG